VEGVGVVEALGPGVTQPAIGAAVLLPHRFGSWREAGHTRADDLVEVPEGVPLEQAAMLRVNPATALLMLREFVDLEPGAWILQNAANSAVGRCVIRIARHLGWKTLNVVRRPELAAELQREGADAVLLEGESLGQEIKAATGGASVRLALNCVGGDSATRLAGALAAGGTIVTYGAMARQPLKIPNGLLIFQDIAWRGFWVTRWFEKAAPAERFAVLAELFELMRLGIISTPIEATYPLEQIAAALAHAQRPGRGGKILLQCTKG
jgi:NADPH:quinone reductase-like Zn-dependent oxidoreductase